MEELTIATIIFRVVLSLFLGGLIGLERGFKNQPAGFRTYMLVCLGATLVMMTNQYGCMLINQGDPFRLGAQVISGIGFLGAGTIIVTARNQVRGLTTAAGLWSAACLGLAIGMGFYKGSIIVGVAILLIMTVFSKVEKFFRTYSPYCKLYTSFDSDARMNHFIDICHQQNITIIDMQLSRMEQDVVAMLTVKKPRDISHAVLIQKLAGVEGLKHIEELS